MKKIFILIISISVFTSLFSYSILESETGNIIGNLDPHSAAMGSAIGSGGSRLMDSMISPANLTGLENGFGFQLLNSFMINSDSRSLPMYNSFDAYCGEAVYVNNVNFFADLSGGLYYKKALSDYEIATSLQYRPFVSFAADYFEQVRNNRNSDDYGYPPKIAQNVIESTGGINAIAFQAAIKYKSFASIGFEVAKLSGESDKVRSITWTEEAQDIMNETLNDTINTLDREFSAIQFKVGADFHISPRIDLALSYSPKLDIDVTGDKDGEDVDTAVFVYTKFDSTGTATDSLTYSQYVIPMNTRLGFTFKPRNIMKTTFNCDLEYVKWSDTNPLYNDAINYYIGVEHILKNKIPFRFGFNYKTNYGLHNDSGFVFANEITTPTFTAGTGFSVLDKFVIDLSVEYSNRQYETLDLFMDSYYDHEDLWENYYYLNLQDRAWENPDTVNETFITLKSAVSFKW